MGKPVDMTTFFMMFAFLFLINAWSMWIASRRLPNDPDWKWRRASMSGLVMTAFFMAVISLFFAVVSIQNHPADPQTKEVPSRTR